MSAPSIFKLDIEWGSLLSLLEDVVTDDDVKSVEAWVAEHEDKLDDKLERCLWFIRERRALANAAAEQAEALTKLAKQRDGQADRLEEIIKRTFEARAIKKRELKSGVISVQANGGKQRLIVTATVDELPASCVKVIPATRSPDNDAIRALLEANTPVAGCELAPRTTRLVIK